MSPVKLRAFGAAAIIALVFVAYLPALGAGYIWDDDDYVTENQCLRSVDGLRRIWVEPGATHQYYPLVHSSFWLEYHLWGLRPFGYHFDNVLLHAVNSLLVWLILATLGVPGAWFAAALFALHPVEVESVAWITERKNVLSAAFYLCALLAYLRFDSPEREARSRKPAFYVLALLLFFCALLSKTVTCTLPAAILILFWWKRGRVSWRAALPLAPMFGLGALMGLGTAWMEKHFVGATGIDWHFSALDRCLLAGRALWFYASKIIWPQDLMFIYPRWRIDSGVAWQYLFPAGALSLGAFLWWRQRRIGRGLLTAALFFLATLGPALGFVDVFPFRYSFVADHFQYLASIGPITVLAAAASLPAVSPFLRFGIAGAVLYCLASLTWMQASSYRDGNLLWLDTLDKNPDCLIAHFNLGNAFARKGKFNEAISHYSESVRIKPDFLEGFANRGSALENAGRLKEAEADFKHALGIQPDLPDVLNKLAWMQATAVEDDLRNGVEAMKLAWRSSELAGGNDPATLEVLAAAEAEAGQFNEASRTERHVLDLLRQFGADAARITEAEARVSLFEAGRPLRYPAR